MRYLVSQHDGERVVTRCHWEQSFVNHNLSTRHAEGVYAIILHQVEFPGVVLQVVGISIFLEIGFHSSRQSLAHSHHLRRLRGIGRFLGRSHILGIFLVRQTQHLRIRNRDAVCSTGQRNGLCGATGSQHQSCHRSQRPNSHSLLFHHNMLFTLYNSIYLPFQAVHLVLH